MQLIGRSKWFVGVQVLILLAFGGVAHADQMISFDKATRQGVYVWNDGGRFEGEFDEKKKILSGRKQYANGDVYEGRFDKQGQRSGKGIHTLPNGGRYEGEFLNGQYHGQGTFMWPEGQKYEGIYVNGGRTLGLMQYAGGQIYEGGFDSSGKKSGRGVLKFPGGDRYEGEFLNGQYHGNGTFTWPDGRQYAGTYVNGAMTQGLQQYPGGQSYEGGLDSSGKKTGRGVHKFPDGGRYEGEFLNGKYHGQGRLQRADGSAFEGQYVDGVAAKGTMISVAGERTETDMEFVTGKKTGFGVTVDGGGRRYEGLFVDGNRQGHGVLIWPSGQRFEGEFANGLMLNGRMQFPGGDSYEGGFDVNGKYSGTGTSSYSSGQRYVGEFVAGKKQGRGVYTWPSGQRFEGEYANGVRLRGRLQLSSTEIYEGGFDSNDKYSGNAMYIYPSGNRFVGEFANGRMLRGRMQYANGESYEGGFDTNSNRSGTGVYTYQSGARYEGEFQNGLFHGYGVYTYPDGDRYAGQWVDDKRVGSSERESQRAQASNDSGPSLFNSVLAIGVGAYVGNATKGLGAVQQSRMMESAINAVANKDATEFNSTANQVKAQRDQEHAAKMQAIQEKNDREAKQRAYIEEQKRQELSARLAAEDQARKNQALKPPQYTQQEVPLAGQDHSKGNQQASTPKPSASTIAQVSRVADVNNLTAKSGDGINASSTPSRVMNPQTNLNGGGMARQPATGTDPNTKLPVVSVEKKPILGPEQLEAVAICSQSKRNPNNWRCIGPGQDTLLYDDTLEAQLGFAGCEKSRATDGSRTVAVGSESLTVIVHLCGWGLWYETDVAKKYGFVVQRNKYQCSGSNWPTMRCKDNYQLAH